MSRDLVPIDVVANDTGESTIHPREGVGLSGEGVELFRPRLVRRLRLGSPDGAREASGLSLTRRRGSDGEMLLGVVGRMEHGRRMLTEIEVRASKAKMFLTSNFGKECEKCGNEVEGHGGSVSSLLIFILGCAKLTILL